MSLFGTIGRKALKAFQSNNRLVLRHSPQPPICLANRLMNMFGKMSIDKEKIVPERPKRPQSAYNNFYKDLAAKLKAENPDMKVKDMAKTIGNQWKNLNPDTKREILENSRQNSGDYKQQIEKWRQSLNESQKETYLLGIRSRRQVLARRRLKSELKRLDYPIRPKSAFNLYVKEAIDNREQTDEPFKEIFKRVVAKWGTLTDEEKESYIESAKSDKIRYLQELHEWQENMKTHENMGETLNKLTKLKNMSSKSYLTPDLKKVKTKKVVKKKAKAKKVKPKTKSKKIKAKSKVKSSSKSTKATKSKSKSTKPKSEKTSNPKSAAKPKESKAKKTKKESSGKEDSSDSSEEEDSSKSSKKQVSSDSSDK